MMTDTIKIERLTSASEHYQRVESLMIDAFPQCERRPMEQLRLYADENEIFSCNAIIVDGLMGGLINMWDFDAFVYIEHFATLPHLRGLGIGSAVLRLLGQAKPIVLEAELPTDSLTRRRIAFYERNGFARWQTPYRQPAYAAGLDELDMTLMVRGETDETASKARHIINALRTNVYGALPI